MSSKLQQSHSLSSRGSPLLPYSVPSLCCSSLLRTNPQGVLLRRKLPHEKISYRDFDEDNDGDGRRVRTATGTLSTTLQSPLIQFSISSRNSNQPFHKLHSPGDQGLPRRNSFNLASQKLVSHAIQPPSQFQPPPQLRRYSRPRSPSSQV
jgi:hypothetical protein